MSSAGAENDPGSAIEAGFGLRLIRVSEQDAEAFVQAQLTIDVAGVGERTFHPSAWCAADGRARAVMLLGRRDDDMLLALPDALVAETVAKLRMFSIGRTVRIEAQGPALPTSNPREPGALALATDSSRALAPGDAEAEAEPLGADWLIRDIEQRMPWLLPGTSGRFLPQMLGLEALDGLSYRKGCYPGQEVIARVHYRGRVTKRTVRFEVQADAAPAPGSALTFGEAAGTVLYATRARRPDRFQGLAVVPSDVADSAALTAGSATGELLAE